MREPIVFNKACSLYQGDCRKVMASFPKNSFTSIVCDPPYALSFHGREWDTWKTPMDFQMFCKEWGEEALRILKPGGTLLAFCGTRTEHRMISGLEDSGLRIKDKLMWFYSQGWTKGRDISKSIDAHLGHKRERIKLHKPGANIRHFFGKGKRDGEATSDIPITEEAAPWVGWNTTLKPCYEPIIYAEKEPRGTYAENALRYGVAGINVGGTRIPTTKANPAHRPTRGGLFEQDRKAELRRDPGGLWTPNVLVGEEVDAMLAGIPRFWYTAKAGNEERDAGGWAANLHLTVKPLSLMQWLCRLVCQPSGTRILDPFAGSGSTLIAAMREGVEVVGIEQDADHIQIIRDRMKPELRRAKTFFH